MKNTRTRLAACLMAGLGLFLSACGGSGSASVVAPDSGNALDGTFSVSQWSIDVDGTAAQTHWGTVTADGASTISPEAVFGNHDGVLTGPMPASETVAFDLDADHNLTLTTSGSVLTGGLSEDGNIAAVASMSDGADPGILLLGRTGEGYANASLSGEYHLAAFFRYGNNNNKVTSWYEGTVTFDGAGAVTHISTMYNSDGLIGQDIVPGFGTYAVNANGTMTWTPPVVGLGPFEGGIYKNGELAVLTASSAASKNQGLVVLVKKGVGMGDGRFEGVYKTVGLISNGVSHASFLGTAFADGLGNWVRHAGELNVDGAIQNMPGTGNLSYEVSASGRMNAHNGHWIGAVSESGRFVVLAGGTSNNSERELWILIR